MVLNSTRTEVLRTAHQIRTLQAGLVRHLRSIYPIDYVGAGEYSIRGIKMFNSDLVGKLKRIRMAYAYKRNSA